MQCNVYGMFSIQTLDLLGENLVKFKKPNKSLSVDTSLEDLRDKHAPRYLNEVTRGFFEVRKIHYDDIIISTMASQITSLTVVYSSVCSGADQRKHQSSASLAFVRGIHRWPVNSLYKGPVTRKMFLFDDVIMNESKHEHHIDVTWASWRL